MTAPVPETLNRVLADRYRLERELGAGGMATGYLAQDLKHDREVAVKESGMSPVWNPNGKELLFIDAAQHMVSVPLVGRESFQTGPSRVLLSTADYYTGPYQPQFDLSRDDQHVVMIRRETGTSLGMVVVSNVLEELRRRMAAQ